MNGVATESPWSSESASSSEWATEVEAGPYEYEAPAFESEAVYELKSPFLSRTSFGESQQAEMPASSSASLESPFLSGFAPAQLEDRQTEVLEQLLAELEDESFEESLSQLVNEAAGQYLASEASWSSPQESPFQAAGELERWMQPLASEMERLLEEMSNRLGAEEFETLRESELETLLESMRPEAGILPEAFENFLGGFFNKIKKVAKGAWNLAKKGISAVGKILPIGFIFNKLRNLVRPLLKRVLQAAVGRLPTSVQPLARTLATKLLGSSETAAESATFEEPGLPREFDIQVASLLLAPSEGEAENVTYEAAAEGSQEAEAPLTELDAARVRLAQQLTELPAGESPVGQLEQFIPAVMAVMPIVRMGINMIGRDRVVGFLADKLGGLIKGMVGRDAAKALSRPIVDVGLRLLRLEAPLAGESALGGEALVATVEDTVRQLMELPAEAFEDTLRMEAEVQQAFAEAAARHVPAELLRPDLPERETTGEGGVWIFMPRATRPRFRYKKYTRVFMVPVSRHAARAIATTDGGTLESHLLDRGVASWPAQAEVHLFETLPGSQMGHIAQFESGESTSMGETLAELQPLTPEAASLLLSEPGLGRPANAANTCAPSSFTPPKSGQRFFQVRLPGHSKSGSARPRHRFQIDVDVARQTPSIRVHLRLSEREAQHIAAQLDPRMLPGVIAWFKERYRRVAPRALAARLVRYGQPLFGSQLTPQQADRLGGSMTEALTRGLTRLVSTRNQELATAVRDPAQGVTIVFTFTLPGRGGASASAIQEPTVTVQPGWRHLAHGNDRPQPTYAGARRG